MRKSNENKLTTVSENYGKEKPGRKSTASKRVNNGRLTVSKGYGNGKTRSRNSTWSKALEDYPEMGDLFDKAIQLKQNGRFEEAAKSLEKTVEKYPQFSPLWWYLGWLYYDDLKQVRKAVSCFRNATEISPKSEKASLGLFHSLWATDQIEEALTEIKRYQTLTNYKCRDYLEIVNELNEKWLDSPKTKKKARTKKVTS